MNLAKSEAFHDLWQNKFSFPFLFPLFFIHQLQAFQRKTTIWKVVLYNGNRKEKVKNAYISKATLLNIIRN